MDIGTSQPTLEMPVWIVYRIFQSRWQMTAEELLQIFDSLDDSGSQKEVTRRELKPLDVKTTINEDGSITHIIEPA